MELQCPACRHALVAAGPRLDCPACGRTVELLATGLYDALEEADRPTARAILAWPARLLEDAAAWTALGPEPASVPPEAWRSLRAAGLIDAQGQPTALGRDCHYHLSERSWQAGQRALDGRFDPGSLRPGARVLDVGCGAGQTLALLTRETQAALFGVDVDLPALALGSRLAQRDGVAVTLVAATAYALPFPDAAFDLVTTRVALNYMHQRRALSELVRVLRPGGRVFCRVEGVWHDVAGIAHATSARNFAARCRDLGVGVVNDLTGWQPAPDGRVRYGRSYASARGLARALRSLGCEVLDAAPSPYAPQFAGRRTQISVLARRM